MSDNSSPDRGDIHSRVTVVERDLNRLSETMSREFADVRKDGEGRHLDLKGMIQGLAATQAERAKVPWQAIGVVVGILVGAGGLLYTPVKERQSEMQEQIHDRVTRNEFLTTLTSIGARRDDAQRTMEGRVGRVEQDVDHLTNAVVPRGELETHWADQRDRDSAFQRELDALVRPQLPYQPTRH
ncbi:hypothetical protein D3273_26225 [Lichenibacterium minor]|uniref:Uncharacterized protein n=1 Tax=Lichenibacterium minor TaxID=2316528 RepID=A0A4V1RTV9_9HYPH|nr:hypothetical protein [Lichenibacterium minor]RYC29014.1 hypothetical protein D3273_26225 [Lichenibacterium minor]